MPHSCVPPPSGPRASLDRIFSTRGGGSRIAGPLEVSADPQKARITPRGERGGGWRDLLELQQYGYGAASEIRAHVHRLSKGEIEDPLILPLTALPSERQPPPLQYFWKLAAALPLGSPSKSAHCCPSLHLGVCSPSKARRSRHKNHSPEAPPVPPRALGPPVSLRLPGEASLVLGSTQSVGHPGRCRTFKPPPKLWSCSDR